jgi:translation initiation factor 4G
VNCYERYVEFLVSDHPTNYALFDSFYQFDTFCNFASQAASSQGFHHLDTYFREMRVIIDSKQTSSRVRFMLQDLIEVRLDNWKPRRDVAGPKTIDQIHKEVEREKNQQQLENLLNKPTRGGPPGGSGAMGGDRDRDRDRGKRSSRGPASGPGQSSNAQEDGWTNVPSRPARPAAFSAYDPNRLQTMTGKIGKVDADSMQLGPGSKNQQFTAWGKGSAGTRLSQTKEDAQKNRFAAFSSSSTEQAPSSSADSDLSRRGASRSMGMSDSRGASADERQRALQAVMTMAGSGTASPAARGFSAAVSASTAQAAPPTGDAPARAPSAEEAAHAQAAQLKGQPDLSEEEVEKLAKPLLDEFIHNCDVKVRS